MLTTVDLPEPIIRNGKLLATERGVTLSAVVEAALRGHLSPQTIVSARKVALPTVRGLLVQPDLKLDRTSALEIADDEVFFAAVKSR